MTDVLANIEVPENMNTKDMFFFFKEQVDAIDEKLDASTESAGRIATRNAIINDTKEIPYKDETGQDRDRGWERNANAIVKHLSQFTDNREKFGVYFGILRTLEQEFSKEAADFLTQITPPPSETDKLSDDDKQALQKQRTEFMAQLRMLKNLNIMMKFGTEEDFVLPKKRTGAHGTRAPRQLSMVQWSIDGVKQEGDANKIKNVATALGFANPMEFKSALIKHLSTEEEPRTDLKEIPNEIPAWTLDNGKILTGTKVEPVKKDSDSASSVESDENDEDEDDDDDDEDEDETS